MLIAGDEGEWFPSRERSYAERLEVAPTGLSVALENYRATGRINAVQVRDHLRTAADNAERLGDDHLGGLLRAKADFLTANVRSVSFHDDLMILKDKAVQLGNEQIQREASYEAPGT
jgi:hypothetical protein